MPYHFNAGLLIAYKFYHILFDALPNEGIGETKENLLDFSNLKSSEQRCSFMHVGSDTQVNFILIILV
jgi:hypothetical protein